MAVDYSGIKDQLNRLIVEARRLMGTIEATERSETDPGAFDTVAGTGTPPLTRAEVSGTSASDPGIAPDANTPRTTQKPTAKSG